MSITLDVTTQKAIDDAKSAAKKILAEVLGAYAEPFADSLELIAMDWVRQRLESVCPPFKWIDGELVHGEQAVVDATNEALQKLAAAVGVADPSALAQLSAIIRSGQAQPAPSAAKPADPPPAS